MKNNAPIFRIGSAIWSALSALSRQLSAIGFPRAVRLDCRVISVGNLQAGGTGKTPLVARIAREAADRGLSAVILLRGYGGRWERDGNVILPREPAPDPRLCGDEAALLHELAPEATIGVGRDRARQYRQACERAGRRFDLAILDDGFQNRRVVKDVELVAVTSATRSETFFRDRTCALRHANLVVWTKGPTRPDSDGRPLVKVRFRLPPPAAGAEKVCLVTGVGSPGAVSESLREAGYQVLRHHAFNDHARYDEASVRGILESAEAGGLRVVTTGKDWVKWKALGIPAGKVQVLEPELIFQEGKERWERVLWG
ncbi:MAG: tetraacyldisaccharide 4'-kinase [Oligoflexia bacterium]|nr:tetraacyldisaccharide 4'-kinase [Oligoflexia bacterium]